MADGDGINVGILRAELAALELRIVDRVTAANEKKADRSQVESIERDLEVIKTIGSPALLIVQRDLNKVSERINIVEKEQLSRQHFIPIVQETAKEVESLKGWRNKLIGGFVLITTIATVNFVRIWFGIG